jgi:hypothetical protein
MRAQEIARLKEADLHDYLRDPRERERVVELLHPLRESYQYIIKRHVLDGCPIKQIAKETGEGEERVAHVYLAAMVEFRQLLKREVEMPPKGWKKSVAATVDPVMAKVFKDAGTVHSGTKVDMADTMLTTSDVDRMAQGERAEPTVARRKKSVVREGARAEFSLPLPQEVELVLRVKIIVEVIQQ